MRSQAAYADASLQTPVRGVQNIFPLDEEPSGSMHKLSVEWKQIVIAVLRNISKVQKVLECPLVPESGSYD